MGYLWHNPEVAVEQFLLDLEWRQVGKKRACEEFRLT
jgi:hypothetical protein